MVKDFVAALARFVAPQQFCSATRAVTVTITATSAQLAVLSFKVAGSDVDVQHNQSMSWYYCLPAGVQGLW